MKVYRDIDSDSGISAYDYGDEWIKVQFRKNGQIYEYQVSMIGQAHITAMKVIGVGFAIFLR